MTAVVLDDYDGRRLPVEYDHDWSGGRTTYRTRHGVFVLGPSMLDDDAEPGAVRVQYGTGENWFAYDPRPDEPVFYGIPIHGATVARPGSMQAARGGLWVNAERVTGRRTSLSVPDGTRRRVASVVWALANHWMALPEHGRLVHAYLVRAAPTRLGVYQHEIGNLTERINELTAKRAEAMRQADRQAALAAETPVEV